MTRDSVNARASAERGEPSKRGSSPNIAPLSSTASTDSRPSGAFVAIAIRPCSMTKSSPAMSPCANNNSLRSYVRFDARLRKSSSTSAGSAVNSSVVSSNRRSGTRLHLLCRLHEASPT